MPTLPGHVSGRRAHLRRGSRHNPRKGREKLAQGRMMPKIRMTNRSKSPTYLKAQIPTFMQHRFIHMIRYGVFLTLLCWFQSLN